MLSQMIGAKAFTGTKTSFDYEEVSKMVVLKVMAFC